MAGLSKHELLDKFIEGCRDGGWGVLVIERTHPFLLRVFNEEEGHTVRVYVWNLTHGGGKKRPADEYRVQVTGIDNAVGFAALGAEKALVLGWWAEGEVFAGFDRDSHSGPLGASPSIQIREEALRHASIRGIATHNKGSGEVAVALRPDMLPEYVVELDKLHGFGQSEPDRMALERVAEDPELVDQGEIAAATPERRTVMVTIAKTLREHSFKDRVLTAYGRHCAFCDLQMKLVDAAHIVPVQHNGSDATRNGLALCALHHRAYDRALVTLNEDYQILMNEERVRDLRSWGLDGGEDRFRTQLRGVIRVPPDKGDRPDPVGIVEANQLRGWN